jgi:hypothetical protein
MDPKSGRDEFSERTIRILQERVGNRCSNPHCQVPTSGPHTEPSKSLRIGKAAHITAAAPGGPRYDPSLPASERSHALNGIWLCGACADLIDKDERRFPVAIIQQWKTRAEAEANEGIKGAPADPDATNHTPGFQNPIRCPHCYTVSESGAKVCLGCFANVFYGFTPSEYQSEFLAGTAITGVLLLMISGFVSRALDQLGFSLSSWFEHNLIVYIVVCGVAALLVGRLLATQMDRIRLRNRGPYFVRSANF